MPDRCIPSNAQKGIIEAGARQWRIQVARYQQGAEIGGRKPGFRLFDICDSCLMEIQSLIQGKISAAKRRGEADNAK